MIAVINVTNPNDGFTLTLTLICLKVLIDFSHFSAS